jgi:SAM-dependent methyltransferase
MPGYHWLPDRLKVRAQARRGRADAIALSRELPALTETKSVPNAIIPNIADRHAEYIRATGTNADMAASAEFCRFLVQLCAAFRPGRIADLGSGISSWTLRTWRGAECPTCEVISVDDNPDWLERSREFSAGAGTGGDDFFTWDLFLEGPAAGTKLDLVVYDFGSVRVRASLIQRAFDLVAPGGVIVCDDIHKARIWRAARSAARKSRFAGPSLREETLDSTGRFAWLARHSGRVA